MKTHSKNTYSTTDGRRYSRSQIERFIRRAKAEKIEQFQAENGYTFCEDCFRSDGILDLSHDVPVKKCLENGQAELAWSVENLTIRCRECHQKRDKLV